MGKLIKFLIIWDVVVLILLYAYNYMYILAENNIMLFINIVFLIIAFGTIFWLVAISKKFKQSNDKALVELIMIGTPALLSVLIQCLIWLNSGICNVPLVMFCLILVEYEVLKFLHSLQTIKRTINFKRLIKRIAVSSQQSKKIIFRKASKKYRNYPDSFLKRRRSFYKYEIYFAGTLNLVVAIISMGIDDSVPWMKTVLFFYLIIIFLPIAFITGRNIIKLQAVEDNLKKENFTQGE